MNIKTKNFKTKIIFDLDETLIHSRASNNVSETQNLFKNLESKECHKGYVTFLRPFTKKILTLAFDLVGKNNVYIGTISLKNYAEDICDGFEFGIERENIFAREQLSATEPIPLAYGACLYPTEEIFLGNKNILIDDASICNNYIKTQFFDVAKDNYFSILNFEPFWGFSEKKEKEEEKRVEEFLRYRVKI